jgi:hypothetical protein
MRGYSAFSYQDIADAAWYPQGQHPLPLSSKTELGVTVINRCSERFEACLARSHIIKRTTGDPVTAPRRDLRYQNATFSCELISTQPA